MATEQTPFTYVEHATLRRVEEAFLKSPVFIGTKYALVAAAIFASTGAILIDRNAVNIKDEMDKVAVNTKSELSKITNEAREDSRDRMSRLQFANDSLMTTIKDAKSEIKDGVQDFKQSREQLKVEVIKTVADDLKRELHDKRGDFVTQIDEAKKQVIDAAEQARVIQSTARNVRDQLAQLGPLIDQSRAAEKQIAALQEIEKSARSAEAGTRDARTGAEASQKVAASAETLVLARLGDAPGKLNDLEAKIAGARDRIDKLGGLVQLMGDTQQQQQDIAALRGRIEKLESLGANIDKLYSAVKELGDKMAKPSSPATLAHCRISRDSCKEVQTALNRKLRKSLDIDGLIGPATKAAFHELQRLIGSTEADSLSDTDTKALFGA
jgi:hypothetical protein